MSDEHFAVWLLGFQVPTEHFDVSISMGTF
jgi:hypothetical protein